jgi:predicted nucleic acid-binding protein
MPLVLDTGVLYALADSDDAWHARCRDYLETTRETLLVPVTVVPEVTYLLHDRLGAEAELAFVRALSRDELTLVGLTSADVERSLALLQRHPDLGFVDCSVVAMTERLKIRVIATTDRRHFARIRPRHASAFELVP